MKATIINIIRATFVSVEMAVIICGFAVLIWSPTWISDIGSRVAENENLLKYLVVVPVAVFVWVFSCSRKILFPENDRRKIFQNWPDYLTFKEVVLVGVGFALLFGVVGVTTWAMDWKNSPTLPFVLIITSVAGSFATAITMHLAEIKINELFSQLTDNLKQDSP